MIDTCEIIALYENGVLRPETNLDLPEHTRCMISVRRMQPTSPAPARAYASFREIRERGLIRLDGWRPTRDELHERR